MIRSDESKTNLKGIVLMSGSTLMLGRPFAHLSTDTHVDTLPRTPLSVGLVYVAQH